MSKVIVAYRNKEFLELVESLGYEILYSIFMGDNRNPKYYLSKGKMEEIREKADALKAERVIVDAILKSSQWYNLENSFNIPVDDKVRLIIDIFADRARSKEAMLQVEYARLQYEIPHLRELVHQLRSGEHPGWMGGGEYEIADYYQMIRRKMARIRRSIEKMRLQREERRKMRKKAGYILVGIAGYTNSGKSTLLKALSGKDVVIEERMFSTLSTRTSKIGKEKILITDTVGFVEDMPPWLIKAFEPTLEEIYNADIVLLCMDGSDSSEILERKMNLSLDILGSRVKGKIIPVINKLDMAENLQEKIEIVRRIGEPVLISAREGYGLEELVERIKKEMNIKRYCLEIEHLDGEIIQFIERFGRIKKIASREKIFVEFEMPADKLDALHHLLDLISTGNSGGLKEI